MSNPNGAQQNIKVVDGLNLTIAIARIYRQSIVYMFFAIVLLALGIAGQTRVASYVLGANYGANAIWISVLWIITSALGLVTFKNNVYRIDTAIPHLVFIAISMAGTIAGIVLVSIGMSYARFFSYDRFIANMVVGSVMLAVYVSFLGCSIYQIIIFARFSQNGVISSVSQQPQAINQQQTVVYLNQPQQPQILREARDNSSDMATVITQAVRIRPISRADFIPAMAHITKQCIVFLVFSILILAAGGVGVSPYGGYVYGITLYFHCFWAAGLMIISCSLGIATYNHGRYKDNTAIAHIVFVVLSGLGAFGGFVLLCLAANNVRILISTGHEIFISAMCVDVVVMIIYLSYIGIAIYQIVIYSRISSGGTIIATITPMQPVQPVLSTETPHPYTNHPSYPNQKL
ncbi:uncharacterized protein TRIADDRAFT_64004 [Trichoplax adhaerens]|uniref:Uncharacterized protein n=1 Tax=Trichoplax adhaerens TaxID=10228 RepID=B3RZC7_TRIAD|nr:predicted protein [Trichoplax adhaerens]EDV23821.1 predicted protein [Trichoplax adhaerens]|eukprot:XP_002113347.1 predicted protein [Trichoplax adhaerens]